MNAGAGVGLAEMTIKTQYLGRHKNIDQTKNYLMNFVFMSICFIVKLEYTTEFFVGWFISIRQIGLILGRISS